MVDLSGVTAPTVGFRSDCTTWGISADADVDLSIDGGASWQSLWHHVDNQRGPRVDRAARPAGGRARPTRWLRFHYTGVWDRFWQIDDAFLGVRTCQPVPGRAGGRHG